MYLEDNNSRFGIQVNGKPLTAQKCELSIHDKVVLGVAENEAVTVCSRENLQVLVLLTDEQYSTELTRKFGFLSKTWSAGITLVLADAGCRPSIELILSLLSGKPIVLRSFFDSMFDGHKIWPNVQEHLITFDYIPGSRTNLLAGFHVGNRLVTPELHLLVVTLGGSFSVRSGLRTIVIGERSDEHTMVTIDELYQCVVSNDIKLIADKEQPIMTLSIVDHNQEPEIETAPIEPQSFGEPKEKLIPLYRDSEVKMVVEYVNLRRPAPNTVSQSNSSDSGGNFKKFKKSQPTRPPSELIGLADMQPYRPTLETGINRSKKEDWLEPNEDVDIQRTPKTPPAMQGTKFRSSFFNEISFE